jgi:calcineurin-like phosphoesterase family protein
MRVWFTADLHLGHGNIIRYCKRPHLDDDERRRAGADPRGRWRVSEETIRRHDEALLDAINSAVGRRDLLWVVGDFCWGRGPDAAAYRDRILCEDVRLIWGNHDHRSVAPAFDYTTEQEMISVAGQDIWLCHYPLRSWNGRFHGAWSLYGHVHGRLSAEDEANPSWLTRDVGVDACDYRPWSFEELRAWMAPRVEAFRRRKEAVMRGEDELP